VRLLERHLGELLMSERLLTKVQNVSRAQHERKILNDIKTPPFVLSAVEGLRQSFLVTCYRFTAALLIIAASLMFSERVTVTLKLYAGERNWLRANCCPSARLAWMQSSGTWT
jgi:hypothetical protein